MKFSCSTAKNYTFIQQKCKIVTCTLHCFYNLSMQIPNRLRLQYRVSHKRDKMFNILRTVSYNCHVQNKYDDFFSEAGRILLIQRRLRWPKFFGGFSAVVGGLRLTCLRDVKTQDVKPGPDF